MPHFVVGTLRTFREDAEFARANSLPVRKGVSSGLFQRFIVSRWWFQVFRLYILMLRLPAPLLEFRYQGSECGREAFAFPLREAPSRGRSFYWARLQCLLWGTITKKRQVKHI